jgi:integral membrane protein 2B
MRVVLPKLELDDDYVSVRTAMVCEDKKIYRLEPLVSGVYKRSIAAPLGEEGTFAEYNGKFVTYDLENIHEVQAAERN